MLPALLSRDEVIERELSLKERVDKAESQARMVEQLLNEVRKTAQRGIEAINHGANVDELRMFFRDIQTGARR